MTHRRCSLKDPHVRVFLMFRATMDIPAGDDGSPEAAEGVLEDVHGPVPLQNLIKPPPGSKKIQSRSKLHFVGRTPKLKIDRRLACDPCMVRPAAPEETYQAPRAHRPEVETGPELSEWVMRHVSGIYKPQRTPRPKLGHARCYTEVYPHTGRSSGAVSGCKPSRQS